jgi:hypothetical protein
MSNKLAFVQITVDRRQLLENYTSRPHPADDTRVNYIANTLRNLTRSDIFQSRTSWTFDIIDSGSDASYAQEFGIHQFVLDGNLARPPLFVDGKFVSTVVYHNDGWHRNANQNFLEAMRVGADRNAEWVVFIEDDVDVIHEFADGVADWLDDHAKPDTHVYVFGAACLPGTPKDLKDRAKMDGTMWETSQQDGEWTYPSNKFMGTQCIALRTEDVVAMVAWLGKDKQFNKRAYGYDCEMRRWAEDAFGKDAKFTCTAPSFVQHTGDESAIHLGRFHIYASWPGPHWTYKKRT